MMHARSKQTPKVTPEMLGLLEWLSGSGWILRNEDFVAIWCNEAYAAIGNLKPEDVVGTKLADYIGDDAAKDRERSYSVAIEENRPVTNIQFTGDDRMLSMIFPIDEEAFGHKGVLCMIQEAPRGDNLKLEAIETVVQSPVFVQLAALSTAELRVLYYLARGNSTQQISENRPKPSKTRSPTSTERSAQSPEANSSSSHPAEASRNTHPTNGNRSSPPPAQSSHSIPKTKHNPRSKPATPPRANTPAELITQSPSIMEGLFLGSQTRIHHHAFPLLSRQLPQKTLDFEPS